MWLIEWLYGVPQAADLMDDRDHALAEGYQLGKPAWLEGGRDEDSIA